MYRSSLENAGQSFTRLARPATLPRRKIACVSQAWTRFRSQAKSTRKRQMRSEEHTSELQSLRHLVCRLLLEKKNNKKNTKKVNASSNTSACGVHLRWV